MSPELHSVDDTAWQALTVAVTDRAAPLRYLTLCNVNEGHAEARTLVLRDVDPATRELTFHTDIRSAKWGQLGQRPAAQVLGLDASAGVQIRLRGAVALHGPQTRRSRSVWATLPEWTRRTYCGGAPGQGIPDPASTEEPGDISVGAQRLGVIVFRATALDWVKLERGANRRALFAYEDAGSITAANWVAP